MLPWLRVGTTLVPDIRVPKGLRHVTPTRIPTEDELALADGLFRAMRLFKAVATSAAQSSDIGSLERAGMLFRLKTGACRPGTLAQHGTRSPSAVTEIVEGLERDGFGRRESDPDERRAIARPPMVAAAPTYENAAGWRSPTVRTADVGKAQACARPSRLRGFSATISSFVTGGRDAASTSRAHQGRHARGDDNTLVSSQRRYRASRCSPPAGRPDRRTRCRGSCGAQASTTTRGRDLVHGRVAVMTPTP